VLVSSYRDLTLTPVAANQSPPPWFHRRASRHPFARPFGWGAIECQPRGMGARRRFSACRPTMTIRTRPVSDPYLPSLIRICHVTDLSLPSALPGVVPCSLAGFGHGFGHRPSHLWSRPAAAAERASVGGGRTIGTGRDRRPADHPAQKSPTDAAGARNDATLGRGAAGSVPHIHGPAAPASGHAKSVPFGSGRGQSTEGEASLHGSVA
jgi:hypothetical protein